MLVHADALVAAGDQAVAILAMLGGEIDGGVEGGPGRAALTRLASGALCVAGAAGADGVDGVLEQLAEEDLPLAVVDVLAQDAEHGPALEAEGEVHRPQAAGGQVPVQLDEVEAVALWHVPGGEVQGLGDLGLAIAAQVLQSGPDLLVLGEALHADGPPRVKRLGRKSGQGPVLAPLKAGAAVPGADEAPQGVGGAVVREMKEVDQAHLECEGQQVRRLPHHLPVPREALRVVKGAKSCQWPSHKWARVWPRAGCSLNRSLARAPLRRAWVRRT